MQMQEARLREKAEEVLEHSKQSGNMLRHPHYQQPTAETMSRITRSQSPTSACGQTVKDSTSSRRDKKADARQMRSLFSVSTCK